MINPEGEVSLVETPAVRPAEKPLHERRRSFVLLAGLGMAVYLAVALAADGEALTRALRQLGPRGLGLVLGLSTLNYGLRFLRWELYLAWLGHRLPTLRHLAIYLGGFAFTVSPAKTGEALRALYLRRHGVSYAESVATLFAERLLDLLAMALLAALIIADRPAFRALLAGVIGSALLFVWLVSRAWLTRWLRALRARVGPRPARALGALVALLISSRRLLRARLMLAGLALGVVAWGGEGLGLWLIARGLDLQMPVTVAIGIYAVAVMAGGAAFFLPGGIGGMEVVMSGLLVAQGARLPVAIIATLLCRLATLWFAVVLGLIAVGLLEAAPRAAEPVADP